MAGSSTRDGILRKRSTAWWSWSDSNQPPKCYGTWFESDQLPWSDTPQLRRAFAVLLDFSDFLILESTPKCYGTWFESDQLPWSDTYPDRRPFVVFRDCPGSWSDSNEL